MTSVCAICYENIDSPVCCVPCGHVYCSGCINRWNKSQRSPSKCPECRELIQNVIAVYIKRGDLNELCDIYAQEAKILKNINNEFKEEIRTIENRWSVKVSRGSDKVFRALNAIVPIIGKRLVWFSALLVWISLTVIIWLLRICLSILSKFQKSLDGYQPRRLW